MDSYTPNSSGGGYMSTVGNILGTIWNTSVNAASVVKDKMNEYEVGSKLMYVGGKAIEAIAYTGSKVIEKGTEIAQSETMQNIVETNKFYLTVNYSKDPIAMPIPDFTYEEILNNQNCKGIKKGNLGK